MWIIFSVWLSFRNESTSQISLQTLVHCMTSSSRQFCKDSHWLLCSDTQSHMTQMLPSDWLLYRVCSQSSSHRLVTMMLGETHSFDRNSSECSSVLGWYWLWMSLGSSHWFQRLIGQWHCYWLKCPEMNEQMNKWTNEQMNKWTNKQTNKQTHDSINCTFNHWYVYITARLLWFLSVR